MSIELVVLVGCGIVVYIFVVLECFVYECREFVFSKFGFLDKYNLWVILVRVVYPDVMTFRVVTDPSVTT